jgi:hypothetical protein
MEGYYQLVASVADGLRAGSLSPEAARQKVCEAGLESFVRVAEKREEAVEAFEDFYGQGYYLWDMDQPEGLPQVRFCLRRQMT